MVTYKKDRDSSETKPEKFLDDQIAAEESFIAQKKEERDNNKSAILREIANCKKRSRISCFCMWMITVINLLYIIKTCVFNGISLSEDVSSFFIYCCIVVAVMAILLLCALISKMNRRTFLGGFHLTVACVCAAIFLCDVIFAKEYLAIAWLVVIMVVIVWYLCLAHKYFTSCGGYITLCVVCVSAMLLVAIVPLPKMLVSDTYSDTGIIEPTVEYKLDGNDAELSNVRNTILDNFEVGLVGEYTVQSSVKLGGVYYKVKQIGVDAFDNCFAYDTVILPQSVDTICASAFSNCSVKRVEVNADKLFLEESFEYVSVNALVMKSDKVATVTLGEGVELSRTLKIIVPSDKLEAYKTANPALSEWFAVE